MPMQLMTLLLGSIMVVNFVLAFTIIFLERKNASSTWAWLMVLFFLPVLGFLLYLLLGRSLTKRRIFTWDTKSRLGVEQAVKSHLEILEADQLPNKEDVLRQYKELYYLHMKNNDALYSHNNSVKMLTDMMHKLTQLNYDLKQAKDHIHLLYYIIRHDQLGTKIADVLIKKAKEGLDVRLLYDDMGSRSLSRKYIKRLENANIKVGAFFPPKIPKVNFKINFRNHRKLAIIDGEIGYIGGFNIGDEYLGRSEKFGYWRDTHLRIQGDAVKTMQT